MSFRTTLVFGTLYLIKAQVAEQFEDFRIESGIDHEYLCSILYKKWRIAAVLHEAKRTNTQMLRVLA